MKTSKTNVLKTVVISCILSLIVLLACSARTSPLYSFLMGDYSDNAVSASVLAGYRWFCGMIPYRDLFVTEGPVYLFLQGVGYMAAGRYGILVLQWISMTLIFAILLRLGKECSLKTRILSLGLAVVGYASLCSGGDSTAEWMLLGILALFYLHDAEKGHTFISGLITGIILGILPLLSIVGVGISVGFVLAQLIFADRENPCRKKSIISCVIGLLLPWVVVCVYFCCTGAFGEFLKGAYLVPIKMAFAQMEDSAELTHKLVKCLLMAFPVLLVFISNKSHLTKEISGYCLWGAALTLWLIIMPNYWCYYLICIPFICIAVMKYLEKPLFRIGLAAFSVLLLIIPAKNYLTYIIRGMEDVTTEFLDDLNEYAENYPDNKIFMLDTDCTYYLESGLCPDYKYFYDQTAIANVDSSIYDAVNDILYGDDSPSCIVNTVKGQYHEEDYEGYTLVQAYIKHNGNLQIYIAE